MRHVLCPKDYEDLLTPPQTTGVYRLSGLLYVSGSPLRDRRLAYLDSEDFTGWGALSTDGEDVVFMGSAWYADLVEPRARLWQGEDAAVFADDVLADPTRWIPRGRERRKVIAILRSNTIVGSLSCDGDRLRFRDGSGQLRAIPYSTPLFFGQSELWVTLTKRMHYTAGESQHL